MGTFLESFYIQYYLPPTVLPENKCFSPEHLIISAVIIFFITVAVKDVVRHRSKAYAGRVLRLCAWSMLALEIFRISWNGYYHGLSLEMFRFDFCNQICMFLPLCVILGDEKIYPYIQELACGGGIAVLAYPLWVFYDYAGFHIMALQSMISHGLMLLCGFIMPFASGKIPSTKTGTRDTLIGIGIVMIIAFVMSHVTGENYMIMRSADGLPFVGNIPFPWYWLFVGPFLFLVIWSGSFGYQKLECLWAHLPFDSTDLYGTPQMSAEAYQAKLEHCKNFWLHPLKLYRESREQL